MTIKSTVLLDAVTATGASEAQKLRYKERSYQVKHKTTAGAGSATVLVQVSNVASPAAGTNVDWVDLATFTLTLSTTETSEATSSVAPYLWTRFKVSAISGTGATISAYIAAEV